jgi:hypothetical protein
LSLSYYNIAMSESTVVAGLDADLRERMAARFDPEREREARNWIAHVIGEALPEDEPLIQTLRDGVILCK